VGLGLLGVSENEVKEVVLTTPKQSRELHKVTELHPLDLNKERELIHLLTGTLEA